MYSLVQMQISRTMFSLIFLMYIGGVLVNCNDDIPFCRKHLKKLKEEIRDWRERCLNKSRHEIISPSCGAEKEYYKERMRTHSKMCFYAGPYPEPYLIVRLPAEIVATDLESMDTTVLIRGLNTNTSQYGLEFDYIEKKIYFTDGRHINRMNFDGGNKEIFAENTDPVDIAIDWKGRRIFWITSKNEQPKIMVMSLDRKNTIARVFVKNEWMACLEIDSATGYIFWANSYHSIDLRQRHMVRDNRNTIFKGFRFEYVKDITLDYQNKRVYVTTNKKRLIAINYSKSNKKEVIGSGYRYPVYIYGTLIYFQKKKSPAENIMEMNLVNRNISRYITLPKNSVPKRFIVVHKSREFEEGCPIKNCGPLRYCINNGTFSCLCEWGYTDIEQTCTDINECLSSRSCNLNVSSCQNTVGSYKCSCKKGYSLLSDGKTCVTVPNENNTFTIRSHFGYVYVHRYGVNNSAELLAISSNSPPAKFRFINQNVIQEISTGKCIAKKTDDYMTLGFICDGPFALRWRYESSTQYLVSLYFKRKFCFAAWSISAAPTIRPGLDYCVPINNVVLEGYKD